MVDHVPKPINPDSFYRTLERWLPPSGTTQIAGVDRAHDLPFPYDLPGIDTSMGMQKVFWDRGLYQKILLNFHQDHRMAMAVIQRFLQQNDREQAGNLAHNLKGAAGNLGALGLSTAAGRLEMVLKKNEVLEGPLNDFQSALEEVMEGIGCLLPNQEDRKASGLPTAGEIDEAALAPLIQALSEALSQALPQEAKNLLSRLSWAMGDEQSKAQGSTGDGGHLPVRGGNENIGKTLCGRD